MAVVSILCLLALLQLKHMLADFYLQTPVMLANRSVYLHSGRALHCFFHVVASALCFLIMAIPFSAFILILIAEFILHFHIDYGKGVWSDRAGHSPADASYWRAFGADQFLHQLTYLGMVLALV